MTIRKLQLFVYSHTPAPIYQHNNYAVLRVKLIVFKYAAEFWKITLMVAPEIIRIFETGMVLFIAENNFSNIFLVIQGIIYGLFYP